MTVLLETIDSITKINTVVSYSFCCSDFLRKLLGSSCGSLDHRSKSMPLTRSASTLMCITLSLVDHSDKGHKNSEDYIAEQINNCNHAYNSICYTYMGIKSLLLSGCIKIERSGN